MYFVILFGLHHDYAVSLTTSSFQLPTQALQHTVWKNAFIQTL